MKLSFSVLEISKGQIFNDRIKYTKVHFVRFSKGNSPCHWVPIISDNAYYYCYSFSLLKFFFEITRYEIQVTSRCFRINSHKTITMIVFAGLRSSQPPYLQCSPPPPKRYDLFPRKCRTTVDCLPELCCPETGRNVCRPPKKLIRPIRVQLSIG